MFNLFRRAAIYSITRDGVIDKDQLNQLLAKNAFSACGSHEMSSTGWQLMSGDDNYCHIDRDNVLLVLCREQKILPSDVIKAQLSEQVEKLEQLQARKIKSAEKVTLREQVVSALLPRALSRMTKTQIWLDLKANRVIVDVASAKRAEHALGFLRRTLGSLPVVPVQTEQPPEAIMTAWLADNAAPAPFSIADVTSVRMDNAHEAKASITFRNELTGSQALSASLQDGNIVTSLVVTHHVDFCLNMTIKSDLLIAKITFSDLFLAQNDDAQAQDQDQDEKNAIREKADFMLMCTVLGRAIDDLIAVFSGDSAGAK